jgi:alpha-1,3-mannosyltransferase
MQFFFTKSLIFTRYDLAGAPAWVLILSLLSKRIHSVFVLRLFNDPIATFFLYLALYLFLKAKHVPDALASTIYSIAVSIKMHPVLYAPAIGLRLVLTGGWAAAVPQLLIMVLVQSALAFPFLMTDATSYFRYSFGGPGALQQVWSVNWKWLPAHIFHHESFPRALLAAHAFVLAFFALRHWCPPLRELFAWRSRTHASVQDDRAWLAIFFSCNFVGICFLRTMHFQFSAWYYHTIPFLAWIGLRPDDEVDNFSWLMKALLTALISLGVEIAFNLTREDRVVGPDGREWTTHGTPTPFGSRLLTLIHFCLLGLLAYRGLPRRAVQQPEKKEA